MYALSVKRLKKVIQFKEKNMKIETTTALKTKGVNFLVYGASGVGKTYLCSTLPKPLIISAEGGLLTLSFCDIPFITVKTPTDIEEVLMYLENVPRVKELKEQIESKTFKTLSPQQQESIKEQFQVLEYLSGFETICLDSITEIAEVILSNEKTNSKDGRQAYLVMGDQINTYIRRFRDLPFNTYFTAKLDKMQDEMGKVLYSASLPGKKTSGNLPYFFDEVFALRTEKAEDGSVRRMLQTTDDGIFNAKDRSGVLAYFEEPNLGAILKKIQGEKNGTINK